MDGKFQGKFIDICSSAGYYTRDSPRMSPGLFVAIDEDGNLLVSQQRIVNTYLTFHFGHQVCALMKVKLLQLDRDAFHMNILKCKLRRRILNTATAAYHNLQNMILVIYFNVIWISFRRSKLSLVVIMERMCSFL